MFIFFLVRYEFQGQHNLTHILIYAHLSYVVSHLVSRRSVAEAAQIFISAFKANIFDSLTLLTITSFLVVVSFFLQ